MRTLRNTAIPCSICLLLLLANSGQAAEIQQFNAGDRFNLSASKTYEGDLYVFAADTNISGQLNGDLLAWSGQVRIDGNVEGDVIVGAGSLDVAGDVSDTIRFFGSTGTIRGRVDGDVVAFGAMLTIGEDAHITGNLVVCAGVLQLDGTVDGDVSFTGGEANLGGAVGGDARIEADAVRLLSGASIQGDFEYTTRKELVQADGAVVHGETIFTEKPEETGSGKSRGWRMALWTWKTLSAIVVGLVLIALFRSLVPILTATLEGEALMGMAIGFGAFLIVPFASLLAIVLIISMPLGLVGLILFFVALYLAKMPVAVWVGRRLLSLAGSRDPSPYVALAVGLLMLHLIFSIPWLGGLSWLVATWLGLGATILATRAHLQKRPA